MTIKENATPLSREDWERQVLTPFLNDKPSRKDLFETKTGIPVKEIYTSEDLESIRFNEHKDIGYPGNYPYVRGVYPSMYRNDLWVMGMYSGYGSAEEANKRYRYLIEQGQTGFSIALDLPTQIGYDSDHELSEGEVGKVGVAIDSLLDIENLFYGVDFKKVRQIRTTANGIGPIMVALLVAYAEKVEIDPNEIGIFLQNDVLKEYIGRGTYIFPPEPSVKLSSDVIEYCSKYLPNWVPLAFSGYHIRDSGSTAVQEIAITISIAMAYMDETIKRGIHVDQFASKLFTFLAADVDLLEEVAKFRATRRVWAKLIKERYEAQLPESMRLRIFAYTLGGTLTAQQPLNNIVRVTIETLAAVLGGVQTIATSSYDEALGLPTEEAVTVALRTQQIVAEESGVTNTTDPFAGSYAMEVLTHEMEQRIWEEIDRIQQQGGAVKLIEEGILQKEVADSSYYYQTLVEKGVKTVVGVNKYKVEESYDTPIFQVDEEEEAKQINSVKKLKQDRDNKQVEISLQKVKKAAINNENTIPTLIEAVKNYATVGEMADVFREVYGIYTDPGKY